MRSETPQPESIGRKKVSIVIPALENLELTRNCWKSIQKNTFVDHEIILVDNGSKEPLAPACKADGIYCIRNDRNLGFAAAVNQGLRAAQGEFLVVLNNDTLVTPRWMERLLQHFEASSHLGLLAPVTNYANNAIQRIDAHYNDEATLYHFSEERHNCHRNECIEQSKVAGVCMVIPRAVMEEVGLFDTRFGIGNFEDDDYCLRVRRAGYRVAIANDVFIHHEGGRTFQLLDLDYEALLDQNSKLFLEKWAPVLGVQGAVLASADQGQVGGLLSGASVIVLQDEETLSAEAIEAILATLPESSSVQLVCEKSPVASRCEEAGIPVHRAARADLLGVVDQQIRASETTHTVVVSSRLNAEAGWVQSLLATSADVKLLLPQVSVGPQQPPSAAQASPGAVVLVDTEAYIESAGLSRAFVSGVAWQELALRMQDCGMGVETTELECLSLRHSQAATCQVDPEEQQLVQSLVRAKEHIVNGEVDEALAGLRDLTERMTDFIQAHEWVGLLRMNREEWPLAKAAYERVVELDPHNASAHNTLGCLTYASGDAGAATTHFEAALRLQPRNLEAARNLAHLSFESGATQRALELYLGIVQQTPDDPQSYVELGSWYEKLGEPAAAGDWYRRALQVAPDCQEAQQQLQTLAQSPPVADTHAVAPS